MRFLQRACATYDVHSNGSPPRFSHQYPSAFIRRGKIEGDDDLLGTMAFGIFCLGMYADPDPGLEAGTKRVAPP
jgi:hypothetical protein